MKFLKQRGQRIFSGTIQFEGLNDEGSPFGINRLEHRLTLIEIAYGSTNGIEALLQSAIETLPRFLAQIADVVRGNDGLDVGGEPPAPSVEIKTFVREVDLDGGGRRTRLALRKLSWLSEQHGRAVSTRT